jgi:flagellar export protein FliJ
MSGFIYRLQRLLEHKEDATKEAERELANEEEQLRAQLKTLESMRLREQELRSNREQVRRDMLTSTHPGGPLSAEEVLRRSEYVKELGIQIEQARSDILSQQIVIEEHEMSVELARERVKQARREVEILVKHRSKQEQRFLREEQAKEELVLDEVGNVLFTTRRR